METLAILFFAAVAGAIWLRYSRARERTRALAANGARAQATILDKFTRSRPKSGNRHYLQYRFTSGDGATHTAKHLVTSQEYLDYEVGDEITVIYDPETATHNRPESYLARKGFLDRRKT
ncbi:MAG: DUF3592 domain-containing protein [Gammaproteobacteria bacterium]|nr:DUF3592 domain-containing protein [Gammaproteobacteria bacterium]